jgi:hypothetical protein
MAGGRERKPWRARLHWQRVSLQERVRSWWRAMRRGPS